MNGLHEQVFAMLRKCREVTGGPPVMSDQDIRQFDRDRLLTVLNSLNIDPEYAIHLLSAETTRAIEGTIAL